jgi:hypothetical protein
MPAAAEQYILDWQLDGSLYSGESHERTRVAARYSNDISDYIEHKSIQSVTTKVSTASIPEKTTSTSALTHERVLSDISRPSERSNLKPRQNKSRSSSLTPSQEWEGYVESIGRETFTINLTNVRDTSGSITDQAEFELRELPENDQKRLEIGSVVRWIVGFERLSNDTRQRVSRIHLRRLPVFSRRDYDEAFEDAGSLLEGLVLDDQPRSR